MLAGIWVPMTWATLDMTFKWPPLQRYYFSQYFLTGGASGKGQHFFLYVLDSKGAHRARNEDVVRGSLRGDPSQGGFPFLISEQAQKHGAWGLAWREFPELENRTAYEWLRQEIYDGQTPLELIRWPLLFGCVFIFGLLPLEIRRDRKAAREARRGQILRGPRLVSAPEFNRLRQSDGIGFETLHWPGNRHTIIGRKRQWDVLRIPRSEENSHFLLMGDSGSGKSSLIRQILAQVRERGESAVVYDPAFEFTPQFYTPTTDVILNPTDKRTPFWAPSDEVQDPAEALALAGSLFPDKPRDNTFFTEASRKIFAHLLRYRPTPQDLTEWMRNMDELDKRVAGTELEAMIPKTAGGQRAAVQGTFNQAAAAFQLLPAESEAVGRWSAASWAKARSGWIFIPSSPTLRESLRPLLSMWLDSLILRLMESAKDKPQRVWFILDELSSLQRLPQLPTAITEGRKSNICLVIGFQGRSQLESLYGHQAEAMLSQPMTKVFLRTSEPHSAEWVSRSIGEVEVARLEETHSQSVPAFMGRHGKSSRLQRNMEPLVMASIIEGLHNLTGYVKSRDLVVPVSFPYFKLEARHPAFLPRALPELESLSLPKAAPVVAKQPSVQDQIPFPQPEPDRGREGAQELEIFE